MFTKLSKDSWKVKFVSNLPTVHTLRDFTIAEKEDGMNEGMMGVRTYFFSAHHYRGLPDFDFENPEIDHHDFMWIPKRQLNEFLT